MSNWPAPCALCGYNGPGFFQPQTHPCAKHATERDALLAEVARLREDLDVVDDDLTLAAKRWQAEAEKALRERDEARAEVERLNKGLRDIRDQLYEADCDCPPEWPRCTFCRTRLRIQLLLKGDKS